MLNGIGGKTIEEAKANLTAVEVSEWWNYRMLRGPMNPHLRMDRVGALVAAVHTGKSLASYMPWSKDPGKERDSAISAGDFEKARALAGQVEKLDGQQISTSRKVASRPAPVVKSRDVSRVVSPTPGRKNSNQLTPDQRRERLRMMKHGK